MPTKLEHGVRDQNHTMIIWTNSETERSDDNLSDFSVGEILVDQRRISFRTSFRFPQIHWNRDNDNLIFWSIQQQNWSDHLKWQNVAVGKENDGTIREIKYPVTTVTIALRLTYIAYCSTTIEPGYSLQNVVQSIRKCLPNTMVIAIHQQIHKSWNHQSRTDSPANHSYRWIPTRNQSLLNDADNRFVLNESKCMQHAHRSVLDPW